MKPKRRTPEIILRNGKPAAVILDIKDDALKILVIEVGHRKNIYK